MQTIRIQIRLHEFASLVAGRETKINFSQPIAVDLFEKIYCYCAEVPDKFLKCNLQSQCNGILTLKAAKPKQEPKQVTCNLTQNGK